MRPTFLFALTTAAAVAACSSSIDVGDPAAPTSGGEDGGTSEDDDGGTTGRADSGKPVDGATRDTNSDGPPSTDPLAALTFKALGTMSLPVTELLPRRGDVAVASIEYSDSGCRHHDVTVATPTGLRTLAPKGRWITTSTSDGRWLVLTGVAGQFSTCPSLAQMTSKVYDLSSTTSTPRTVPTGAFATATTIVVPATSTVSAQLPATGAALWTVDGTTTGVTSVDGTKLLVKFGADTEVIDVASGAILTKTSQTNVRFLTSNGSYLSAVPATHQLVVVAPSGTATTLAGDFADVSADGTKLLWRPYDAGAFSAMKVRTLATNADVTLGPQEYASFSANGAFVDSYDGYYPVAGGAKVVVPGGPDNWAATPDHATLVIPDATATPAAPKYALRTAGGTTTIPGLPSGIALRFLAAPTSEPTFVAFTSVYSIGGRTHSRQIYLVTTTAGKPNAAIELLNAAPSAPLEAGQMVGWNGGVFYYRANDELRAITFDGKYRRALGPARLLTLTGIGTYNSGGWPPFTGIFTAIGTSVAFVVPSVTYAK